MNQNNDTIKVGIGQRKKKRYHLILIIHFKSAYHRAFQTSWSLRAARCCAGSVKWFEKYEGGKCVALCDAVNTYIRNFPTP